jgi:hypothetical protein
MATKTTAQPFPETWEQFCEQTGRDPLLLPDTSVYDEKDQKHALADFKLTHMIRHVNGEEVDHTNRNQDKYEIWWKIIDDKSRPSGLGLSCNDCFFDNWTTYTRCGPRLCFLDYNTMIKASKLWLDLFIDYHL